LGEPGWPAMASPGRLGPDANGAFFQRTQACGPGKDQR
jgi:hypothetical protein